MLGAARICSSVYFRKLNSAYLHICMRARARAYATHNSIDCVRSMLSLLLLPLLYKMWVRVQWNYHPHNKVFFLRRLAAVGCLCWLLSRCYHSHESNAKQHSSVRLLLWGWLCVLCLYIVRTSCAHSMIRMLFCEWGAWWSHTRMRSTEMSKYGGDAHSWNETNKMLAYRHGAKCVSFTYARVDYASQFSINSKHQTSKWIITFHSSHVITMKKKQP